MKYNIFYFSASSAGVSFPNLFRFNEMGCYKYYDLLNNRATSCKKKEAILKLLFLSYMHTNLYVFLLIMQIL